MRALRTGVALAVLALGGCGVPVPDPPGTPSVSPRTEAAPGPTRDQAFPTDTLQDWVTYGDRVVAVQIVAETRGEPTPGAGPSEQRLVTWEPRTVWWANPARPDEEPPPSGTAGGGSYTSQRRPQGVEPYGGDPVLFVGHTYLAVLTHTSLGPGDASPREWVSMAMLPFDDGLVGDGERFGGWQGQEAALDAVWGKTGPEVAAILRATPVDPCARPYASQDAGTKWQATAGRDGC